MCLTFVFFRKTFLLFLVFSSHTLFSHSETRVVFTRVKPLILSQGSVCPFNGQQESCHQGPIHHKMRFCLISVNRQPSIYLEILKFQLHVNCAFLYIYLFFVKFYWNCLWTTERFTFFFQFYWESRPEVPHPVNTASPPHPSPHHPSFSPP